MIKAIIIDDEQLARELITSYLEEDNEIEVLRQCENGFEGLKAIQELEPDIVFLDIKMPKITGFEMLELLDSSPVIVFSTAYDAYAIKAFDLNAADYLLKPYSRERFQEAVEKAKDKVRNKTPQTELHNSLLTSIATAHAEKLNRIVVKTGSKIHIIPVSDISYLEAMDDYVEIFTSDGKFLKQATMKFFESRLDDELFVRIHRSYIVAIQEIIKLEPMGKDTHVCILKRQKQLAVSRSGYSRLKGVLGF
jgi:two-component system LytT family response regulator